MVLPLMKIIRMEIPFVTDTRINPNANEEYENWKIEAHKELGIPIYPWNHEKYYHIITPADYVWVGETLFYKRNDEKFFTYADYGPRPPVEILCPCWSKYFTLRYGSYELIATCGACGEEDVVYSG